MSISKGIGGDNTLTISSRFIENNHRPIIEVIEYGNDDFRVVHYTGESMYEAANKANELLADEERTAKIQHERFEYKDVREALFPPVEYWKSERERVAQEVISLREKLRELSGTKLYMVNYTVSNTFTAYVEATSPEDAQHVVEEIYQNNYDILPEDGELDHEIELGIPVTDSDMLSGEEIYSITDALNL